MVRRIVFCLMLLFPIQIWSQWSPRNPWDWNPVYIMLPNGTTPCKADFEDFIAFAGAFNSRVGDPKFNILADTDSNGEVDFNDFIAFAGSFNKEKSTDSCLKTGIAGQVTSLSQPLPNVWIDILKLNESQASYTSQTDSMGAFHIKLSTDHYNIVPKKFGYTFTPDTLQAVITDSAITIPTITASRIFDLLNLRILQNAKPFPGVEVTLSHPIISQSNTPMSGITDTSGVTTIRIPTRGRTSTVSGYYAATITNPLMGETLDQWTSLPIRDHDHRQLVLEIGSEHKYVPERKFFYREPDMWQIKELIPSESRFWAAFLPDIPIETIAAQLNDIGLRRSGWRLELTQTKGWSAILEAMHLLKRSGLVSYVFPYFDVPFIIERDRVEVIFIASVTESDIQAFVQEIGASQSRQIYGNKYELQISNVFTYDIFEIIDRFRDHPLIYDIWPSIRYPVY